MSNHICNIYVRYIVHYRCKYTIYTYLYTGTVYTHAHTCTLVYKLFSKVLWDI